MYKPKLAISIVANRARWGKLDLCPKQPQVGYKYKLALKLLELLMRSTTVNKMSEKLGTLRKRRRDNLERRSGIEATRRDLQWQKPALAFLKRV
ncbi:hypothetical protein GW17_00009306 [Ensete ventricosum]|nr:hypothetical protein GW17_00009306 [Ensete ventricosum]